MDKKIKHENERWELGKSTMNSKTWRELLDSREAAWDIAEAVSRSTGFPFKERDGKWVNKLQNDLIGLSLCEWCRQHNIIYQ